MLFKILCALLCLALPISGIQQQIKTNNEWHVNVEKQDVDAAGFAAVQYYTKFEVANSKNVSGLSCKSWRTESWEGRSPQHEDTEAETLSFIMGIGPAKTATTSTFTSLASNPNVCYYRSSTNVRITEVDDLFASKKVTPTASLMLSHLAPADCCKTVAMKAPKWACFRTAPYQMKSVFKDNKNVKLVLTIREPGSAYESLFNHICTQATPKYYPAGVPFKEGRSMCADTSGETFMQYVEKWSEEFSTCATGMKAQGFEGFELAEHLDICQKPIALQIYDYEATYKRYFTQFGDGHIICQFMTDLASVGGDANRRGILDFAGLTDIDEHNVVPFVSGTPKKFELSFEHKERVRQLYFKYNGYYYSEDHLRTNVCATQTV